MPSVKTGFISSTSLPSAYERMIQGLIKKAKKKRGKLGGQESWSLYILQCSDGTFYTGIAKNLAKRFEAHSAGKGAKYTRTRRPLTLIYQEFCKGRAAALVREYEVKSFSRKKKEALITASSLKKSRPKKKPLRS